MKIELFQIEGHLPDSMQAVAQFQCSDSELNKLIPGTSAQLDGTWVSANSVTLSPQTGDRYVARFTYRNEVYLYDSTLHVASEERGAQASFRACLHMGNHPLDLPTQGMGVKF